MKWESYSHPISDIRDWHRSNRLDLQPDFQRNVVWSKAAQIMLIDTILNDIPIPKIYIKTIIKDDENTYRTVVDGQQRLTAIIKFLDDDLPLNKPYDGELKNKKFSELPQDIKNMILRYKIDINEINEPTDSEVRDLYARVNKYTVQLNKQELRKADFPGDFIQISEYIASNETEDGDNVEDFLENAKIFSVAQRRRMLDVEFIEELLAVILEGEQDKKDSLDDLSEKYMDFPDDKKNIQEKFYKIINDMYLIFDNETMPMSQTRFKQKADFYSLFGCIHDLHENGFILEQSNIEKLRTSLKIIDLKVDPNSEEEIYREYASRCISSSNTLANRVWRKKYLYDFIKQAYIEG